MIGKEKLIPILEAILFSAGKPLTEAQILQLFTDEEKPSLAELRQAIYEIKEFYQDRGISLVELASGMQFQSKIDFAKWISRLWEEKPAKYSRAFLETLALVAYRQPITRGEIEDIRGVSISSSIFKTLLDDRKWIRIVGHKDVPGKPGLYATTKQFLDYFGLNSLDELPSLPEVLSMDKVIEKAGDEKTGQLEMELNKAEEQEQEQDSEAESEENIELNEEQATEEELELEESSEYNEYEEDEDNDEDQDTELSEYDDEDLNEIEQFEEDEFEEV